MSQRPPIRTVVVLLTALVALPSTAHELWLQPARFMLTPDQTVRTDIRIGQHFKGDEVAYLPQQNKAIRLALGDRSRPITPRLGDLPAITVEPLGEGLNILTLASNLFTVTYYEPGKFASFLREEGLDWVLAEHQRRGLPDVRLTEAYRRHAKALLGVGHGQGSDLRTGLEFEWVLQSNPYTSTDDELVAQLWWRNQPFAEAQCRLFVKQTGEVEEIILHTDADGRVMLPRRPGAVYLLNAVHMLEPDAATTEQTGAVWESRWASVTFAMPEAEN